MKMQEAVLRQPVNEFRQRAARYRRLSSLPDGDPFKAMVGARWMATPTA